MAIGKTTDALRLRLRRLMMCTMYVLVVDVAVFSVLRPGAGTWSIVWSVALATTATLWCIYDAQARGRPIVTSFHALIFFTWCFSVPAYLIQSRKLRGLFVALGHGMGMLVLFGVIFFLTLRFLDLQGHAALLDGDYDRAARIYSRFVCVIGDEADSWYKLGIAYQGNGQLSEAISAYDRALRIAPHLTDCQAAILTCRAYQAHDQGDFHEAIARYEEALAVHDSDPLVWYNLGSAYASLGDQTSAIAACEKACLLAPDNTDYRDALTAQKHRASTHEPR